MVGPIISFREAATGNERFQVRLKSNESDRIGSLNEIAYSPNGRLIAVARMGGTVIICDARTGEEVNRFSAVDPPPSRIPVELAVRHLEQQVDSIAFSTDSLLLVTGGGDGSVRMWDAQTGHSLLRRDGHDGHVRHVTFGADVRRVLTSARDGQAYLWSLMPTGIDAKLSIDALWANLADEHAAKAYRAVWSLGTGAETAVPLIRKKLPPIRAADPRWVAQKITDLDSDRFTVRDAARKALESYFEQVIPALEVARKNPASAESRERLDKLLALRERRPTTEDMRRARAVQAMEIAGTTEARNLLGEWAAGVAGARLTEDAKAALRRLDAR
jgi:hypothetical protein